MKKDILKKSNEEINKLTKDCLQTALIKVMLSKKFEEITITELVKTAGVSRTAFYRNYNTKEDIILEICDKIINHIISILNSNKCKNNYYQFFYDLFSLIKKEEKNIKLLFQANLFNSSIINFSKYLEEKFNLANKESKYILLTINVSILAIIKNWLDNNMVESIEFMASFCTNIINKFIDIK